MWHWLVWQMYFIEPVTLTKQLLWFMQLWTYPRSSTSTTLHWEIFMLYVLKFTRHLEHFILCYLFDNVYLPKEETSYDISILNFKFLKCGFIKIDFSLLSFPNDTHNIIPLIKAFLLLIQLQKQTVFSLLPFNTIILVSIIISCMILLFTSVIIW